MEIIGLTTLEIIKDNISKLEKGFSITKLYSKEHSDYKFSILQFSNMGDFSIRYLFFQNIKTGEIQKYKILSISQMDSDKIRLNFIVNEDENGNKEVAEMDFFIEI